jgi:MFS family permease
MKTAAAGYAGPAPQLLLAGQLIFNVGFYSVVPFLAVAMRDDFGMGAMAVGIVLGARTFAQQGLFLAGGAVADRWGAPRAIVCGCLVRMAGYLLLAGAADFRLFLLGAVVTGIGGALFSPALESLVGSAEESRKAGRPGRATLFTLLVICGEAGAVAGPLFGALLWGSGFDAAVLTGAGVFAVMAGVFWRVLPSGQPCATAAPQECSGHAPAPDLWSCLRDRRFVWFAAFFSVNLLAYNQLYLGLPVELERSGAGLGALAAAFAYASALTITLQWPMARLMRLAGPGTALPLGFALQAMGFATVAAMASFPPAEGFTVLPAMLLVTALSLGHMCVVPVAMGLVLDFASGRRTGTYFGLLASCGGTAVLVGNAVLAPLYEHAATPSPTAAAPWLFTALLATTSAAAIRFFLPGRSAPRGGRKEFLPAQNHETT